MNSPVSSVLDFSSFARELNQSPLADYAISANSNTNCCAADSPLSKKFENAMQKLICNCDLDGENNISTPVITEIVGNTPTNSAFCSGRENHNESLATTVDFDEEPLELTGEWFDESGEAADEGSSDEQQHSRSQSLSYSLSVSHAQENFSQYSQSTDKGLSKRYDSPCSYEDDRESECSNFDKLDDWNEYYSDMQNNNGIEATNRDFREYYDEYVSSKGQMSTSTVRTGVSEEGTASETDTKNISSICGNAGLMVDNVDSSIEVPDNKKVCIEKCQAFLRYRNPTNEMDDELMALEDEVGEMSIERSSSFKRKFCYEDSDDYQYELNAMITEKCHKTDFVPDRGNHEPISRIDEEQFARMTRVESLTPLPNQPVTNEATCMEPITKKETDCDAVIAKDDEGATTSSHPRAFNNAGNDNKNQSNQLHRSKNSVAQSAIRLNNGLRVVDNSSMQERGNVDMNITQKADEQKNAQ
ncbi:uncharacterized protein LOC129721999 isoform X2 [Wyeomyia smithii]|uniref:uncharacterized protein LOC129721999 isoform X2 n=1 Tax=Wyeomyia smithii TaxID=174621 RepID=UPI0024681F9D|nr:uncharacterized protein LOC129721999 isoform X2 [Wyeomyia smithii]